MNVPHIYQYKRIVQAKLFIDSNYHLSIDLNNIADEAAFSKYHFIRLFQSIYKSTPHQYMMKLRIDKAEELLKDDVNVKDVCCAVGFDSVSSFTALFRKMKGCTPSEFRARALQRRNDLQAAPLKYIPGCFVNTK